MNLFTMAARKKASTIPIREQPIENELLWALQRADLLVYRFGGEKDFLGGTIAHFTNSPYSHSEVHLYDGYTVSASAIGVIYRDIFSEPSRVDIFRYTSLTREQRLIIEAKAQQSVFRPYHYLNLIAFPFISDAKAAEWSKNHAYICSEVCGWCYKEAGIDYVPTTWEAAEAPADIANSPVLTYFGTYDTETGKNVSIGARGKCFEDEQYSKASVNVSNILKAFSKKDETYKK